MKKKNVFGFSSGEAVSKGMAWQVLLARAFLIYDPEKVRETEQEKAERDWGFSSAA